MQQYRVWLSLLILEQAFDDPNTCKLHRIDDQCTKEGGKIELQKCSMLIFQMSNFDGLTLR
jgi:hypothetical protein